MAELIAAGTAIGVASSFITFSDVAWRVLKRLKEYSDGIEDAPVVIRHIKAQLPILIDKMAELKQANEDGSLTIPPQSALDVAVRTCEDRIKDLDDLTMEMCLETGDMKSRVLRKALFSIRHEKKVSKAWQELEGYKTTFIWHFTKIKPSVEMTTSLLQSTEPAFMVPFEKDSKFVGRDDTMTEIDEKFKSRSRVALAGIGGIG
jgi:N-terminal domain on NACHT_NTPase and P-loop NTPases